MKIGTTLVIFAATISSAGVVARADEITTPIGFYMTGQGLTIDCRAYLTLARANMKTSDAQLSYQAGICLGAVMLFYDAAAMERSKDILAKTDYHRSFCVPNDTNTNDLTEVVANYVDQHPEKRGNLGWNLIEAALADKCPCLIYDALPQ
jgi:imidazoleglycerol phosphate synthase glutamine amidotransferase subunit HisH